MRYRVDFVAIADATASVYVEAESKEEAQRLADAVDRKRLDWDINDVDDETIEEVRVVPKPRLERRPPLASLADPVNPPTPEVTS